jgi:plasmid stability protein
LAQILVRKLPDAVVERLKARAKRNNRSLEAEVRVILEESVVKDKAAFLERAAAMRARLSGRPHTESWKLLREDRDR